jgi:carnitine 3-dehydrogenase
MAHMLDHFGAALEEPWTRLQAPPLTPELRDRMIEGCLSEADGRSIADLERLRDGFLAELLELVERYAVTGRGDALLPVAAAGPTAAALG